MLRQFSIMLIVAGGVLLMAATPIDAHHSIAAEFDVDDQITLTGTIKEVVRMSPDMSVFIDVSQEDGSVLTYEVRGGLPSRLFRNGFRADDLDPGDAVVVEGARARKPESLRVSQGSFRTPDGTPVWED